MITSSTHVTTVGCTLLSLVCLGCFLYFPKTNALFWLEERFSSVGIQTRISVGKLDDLVTPRPVYLVAKLAALAHSTVRCAVVARSAVRSVAALFRLCVHPSET